MTILVSWSEHGGWRCSN